MSNGSDTWREAGPDFAEAFRKNGMGRVERFRVVESPGGTNSRPASRGKGKSASHGRRK